MSGDYIVSVMHANGEMKKRVPTPFATVARDKRDAYLSKGYLVDVQAADAPLSEEALNALANAEAPIR